MSNWNTFFLGKLLLTALNTVGKTWCSAWLSWLSSMHSIGKSFLWSSPPLFYMSDLPISPLCHWCLLWELFVAFFLPNVFHVDTRKGRKVCSPCFRHVGRRRAPRAELLPNITKYKCESKFLWVQWSWWKCVLIICWTVLFSESELSPIFPEHLFFFFLIYFKRLQQRHHFEVGHANKSSFK